MAGYTNRISEDLYPLTAHPCDSTGTFGSTGTFESDWVQIEHRGWLTLCVGDIAAGGFIDAGLEQATSVAGAGAKAIAGKTITQLSQAGGDSDSLVCIELQAEEFDVNNRFAWVRFYLTVSENVAEICAILWAHIYRQKPAPTANWQEIVG